MKFLYPLLALLFLASCAESIKEKPLDTYYDMEGLIDQQINTLADEEHKIIKKISINGEEETDTVSFDSAAWANELEVFRLANINKPNLKGMYNAKELQKENEFQWLYKATDKKVGIEFLKVFFTNDSVVKKIEARYFEKNALYNSERNLEMAFKETGKRPTLASYRVYGSQQMLMKDEVEFSIESDIM